MSDSDKSIYGRKVFFVNANVTFDTQVISRLRLMEFEVYGIDDYRKTKAILRKNPDSICFIIMESQLSIKGWHNFIKSFESENVFSPLDIGVITLPLAQEKLDNFKAGLQLDAGIFINDSDLESLLHKIVIQLDTLQAKGLRKYVRANCLNEKQADCLWVRDNRMFRLKVIDISSVGIAAKLSPGQANAVHINQIITDVTLSLKSEAIPVDIKITAIKTAGDFLLVVIMFETSTLPDSINRVRKYIADNLEENMRANFRSMDMDRVDYEKTEFHS